MDLDKGELSITQARVSVSGHRTVTGPPKTSRGRRTLPIPDDLRAALRALSATQAAERLQLGPDWPDTGLVVLDEIGRPVRPERYSDLWRALLARAGLPAVTLHEARHSSVTAMRERGVADYIVAAWHGHDEVVMARTYSHALDAPLAAASDVLAELRKPR